MIQGIYLPIVKPNLLRRPYRATKKFMSLTDRNLLNCIFNISDSTDWIACLCPRYSRSGLSKAHCTDVKFKTADALLKITATEYYANPLARKNSLFITRTNSYSSTLHFTQNLFQKQMGPYSNTISAQEAIDQACLGPAATHDLSKL